MAEGRARKPSGLPPAAERARRLRGRNLAVLLVLLLLALLLYGLTVVRLG